MLSYTELPGGLDGLDVCMLSPVLEDDPHQCDQRALMGTQMKNCRPQFPGMAFLTWSFSKDEKNGVKKKERVKNN